MVPNCLETLWDHTRTVLVPKCPGPEVSVNLRNNDAFSSWAVSLRLDNIKDIGVYFDAKLDFKDHMHEKK